MSVVASAWNAIQGTLFKATYNPDAEAALAEQRKAGAAGREDVTNKLKEIRTKRDQLVAQNAWQPGFNKDLDTYLSGADEAVASTVDRTLEEWTRLSAQLTQVSDTTFKGNEDLMNIAHIVTIGLLTIEDLRKNETITKELYNEMKTFFTDLQTRLQQFNEKNKDTFPSVSEEYASIQAKVRERLGTTGKAEDILKPQTYASIQKIEAAQLAAEEGPQNTISVKRAADTTWETIVSYFWITIYLILAFLGGMLAANDMLGRSAGIRILFFIYGFIFGPFTCIYYLVRRLSGGKRPNIYTLLPLIPSVSKDDEASGSFFSYPFRYKEDGHACRMREDFLNKSAAILGQKRESKPCPTDPSFLDRVPTNLEKLKLHSPT